MNTILLFPPSFAVDQPYLALPSIISFLRKHGITYAHHWDCNIDSFWHFLSIPTLRKMLDRIDLRREDMARGTSDISEGKKRELEALCWAKLVSEPVLECIGEAKSYFTALRAERHGDEYAFYKRVLSRSLEIVSAAYYPTVVSMQDFVMRFSSQHSEDILRAAISPENPYLEYFEQETIPRLQRLTPRLVGVSVACMSQIIPSFTLATLIKQNLPETKVVFGGQVFNRLVDRVLALPRLFEVVDYFVCREGETALLKLIHHLDGKAEIDEVPNLIYLDPVTGQPVINKLVHVEDVTALPPPDFSDLDLSQYLSPKPVLPYQPVRGCYWHKCAFCNHFAVYPGGERAKTADNVADQLRYLKERYNTNCFTMVNESVRPEKQREYAEAFNREDLRLDWYVGGRFDPGMDSEALAILHQSGCRKIYFGLESGSQSVLDSMRKGTSLELARMILTDCNRLGIGVHLFIMLGFPTEGLRELHDSKATICELVKIVSDADLTYYISVYQLKPCTPIFFNPEQFGIRSVRKQQCERDLEYLFEFDYVRPGVRIDYEAERAELERLLDEARGMHRYPENIVHYLAMRESFDAWDAKGRSKQVETLAETERREYDKFAVRPYLGFIDYPGDSEFEIHGKSMRRCLIYDLFSDEVFAILDPSVWRVLQRITGAFDLESLRETLAQDIEAVDPERAKVKVLVKQMLESGLIVPAE